MTSKFHYDVIVVGSGAAGMMAAITSAEKGLSVLVLEKTPYIGGTTAISGGTIWIPLNQLMETVDLTDSREDVREYLQEAMGGMELTEEIDGFLENGPKMLEFLLTHTSVRFNARNNAPDYYPDKKGWMPGGRALDPVPFDGRKLGSLFSQLRPPLKSFTALGGMMVNRTDINHLMRIGKSISSTWYSLKILARYVLDRLQFERGTRLVLGNALAGGLFYSAASMGVEFLRNSRVSDLIESNGRVIGVQLKGKGGETKLFADSGVVLATGGFGGNVELRKRFISNKRHLSMAPEGNTGDGMRMARGLKAICPADNFENAFFTPVSSMTKPNGVVVKFPHLLMDRAKPGLIAVNRFGKRFINEAICYHEFGRGLRRTGLDGAQPKAHLIVDSRFIRSYGLGMIRPGRFRSYRQYIRSGYLKFSSSLEGLAQQLKLPVDALLEEVTRNNEFACTGVDLDFRKGDSPYDRYLGDSENFPNPCLGKISEPPFYAVTVYPGDIGTAYGLKTDRFARVLRCDGGVIEGLYACGNDMNSIMRGVYPGAGITLGPALTFGFIAGKSLLDNSPRR